MYPCELCLFLQDNKVVLLEDLASHFGMRTQDAIERLQNLLADGCLTGWWDPVIIRNLIFTLWHLEWLEYFTINSSAELLRILTTTNCHYWTHHTCCSSLYHPGRIFPQFITHLHVCFIKRCGRQNLIPPARTHKIVFFFFLIKLFQKEI